MERKDLARVMATGVILGVVCAGIVWWLERFEAQRLVEELRAHLDNMSEEYRTWLSQRPSQ